MGFEGKLNHIKAEAAAFAESPGAIRPCWLLLRLQGASCRLLSCPQEKCEAFLGHVLAPALESRASHARGGPDRSARERLLLKR